MDNDRPHTPSKDPNGHLNYNNNNYNNDGNNHMGNNMNGGMNCGGQNNRHSPMALYSTSNSGVQLN